jgi:type III pantothenate kinase
MNGIIFEIEGIIAAYQQQFGDVKVLLTGGDADLLQKSIKFPIFAAPNNVLWGLYEILRYNVQK